MFMNATFITDKISIKAKYMFMNTDVSFYFILYFVNNQVFKPIFYFILFDS